MYIIKIIIQILAAVSGCLTALLSILFFIRLRWPAPVLWIIKLFTSALSPFLCVTGLVTTAVGLTTGSVFISLVGIYDVLVFYIHIYRVTRPPDSSGGFEQAYGSHWENRISREQRDRFLPKRNLIRLPAFPNPGLKQDISFAQIPGTDRKLLCDVWEPPSTINRSGIAFIYLHGSAFYFLDKDCGTRPFFRFLAARGHVIMDVAHRLSPETGIMGMVNDTQRAIVWMKENAITYGVNPNLVVLGGGSSGGHLAMLTAYTTKNPLFTPEDLKGKDLGVNAVISLYGSNDLEALYYHTNQHLTTRLSSGSPKKTVPVKMPAWVIKKMGENYHRLGMDKGFENAGALAHLLGGHPDECPDKYAFFSPVSHIHAHCPPTLLIHGEQDIIAPVKTTRLLHAHLIAEKVPVVMHLIPQTDHAFDLVLPGISPSAHNAWYDIERFLALQVDIVENRETEFKKKKDYQFMND